MMMPKEKTIEAVLRQHIQVTDIGWADQEKPEGKLWFTANGRIILVDFTEAGAALSKMIEQEKIEARIEEMNKLSDAEGEAWRLAGTPANPNGEPVYAAEYARDRIEELKAKLEGDNQ